MAFTSTIHLPVPGCWLCISELAIRSARIRCLRRRSVGWYSPPAPRTCCLHSFDTLDCPQRRIAQRCDCSIRHKVLEAFGDNRGAALPSCLQRARRRRDNRQYLDADGSTSGKAQEIPEFPQKQSNDRRDLSEVAEDSQTLNGTTQLDLCSQPCSPHSGRDPLQGCASDNRRSDGSLFKQENMYLEPLNALSMLPTTMHWRL